MNILNFTSDSFQLMTMDVACRFVKARSVAGGQGTRSRVVVRAVDSDTVSRRDGMITSLSLLGAGLSVAFDAEARTDPYYDELLNSTKGLDTADLLSKYKKMSSSEGGKRKGSMKREKKGGSGRGSTSSTFSKSASKGAAVNPVEVGLGLAGLAGVVAIGRQGSKGGVSNKKTPTPSKPKTQKKKVPAGTVRLSAGTTRKAPVAGTQRKAPVAGTKKVGTVTRKMQGKKAEEKSESSNGAAPALLVGLVAVIGAFVALGSKPISEQKPAAAKTETSPVVKEIVTETPSEQSPVVTAPPVKSETKAATSAPVVAAKEEKSASSPQKSRLPPTTGNSPIVLIGGSIATLVVAAAVGGGSENTSANTVQDTPASSAIEDDAAFRKKEAREWIEAWRSKQK